MTRTQSPSAVVENLRVRRNAVDAARDIVIKAVKTEINGHMSQSPLLPKLTLGHPQKCAFCGNVYLERREPQREGYGLCPDKHALANAKS